MKNFRNEYIVVEKGKDLYLFLYLLYCWERVCKEEGYEPNEILIRKHGNNNAVIASCQATPTGRFENDKKIIMPIDIIPYCLYDSVNSLKACK